MALFEDESIDDLDEEINEYLSCPEKGLELIKKLLVRKTVKDTSTEFATLLSDKVLPVLAELDLKNELEIYKLLVKIEDKLKEQQRIRLLIGKKILGVGGKFSAGKSCFINSITNANLPVGQRPTTSIATYIVNASREKNIAISNNDNVIELDDAALEALTHQFYERYQIGFSKIVKNLVVYTPGFIYPNVVILDTPGYSKSDADKRENSSDAGMAREQLKSVDYLIWLVDSVQGVITERDLEFISSLNVNSEILVVFTKASMETEQNLIRKIETAKSVLGNMEKRIYDVIAYDSEMRETLIGKGVLENFLSMVNNADVDTEDVSKQIGNISRQLERQTRKQVKKIKNQLAELEKILIKTSNIEHISAVVKEYGRCKSILQLLEESRDKLADDFDRLIYITDAMKRSI